MKYINKYYPYLIAIIGFMVISLFYFYPVLQGKQIYQSDIAQYTGMAKEQNDFRKDTGEEPYWTNSAFGGMPTYQLGANYPHNYIKQLDYVLRFLPRPADYLFLYFLGFFVLMRVLKIDPLKAFFGALAFGFSTYLIIILGVGHNAKAHAIAYMPMVVAGVVLVFKKRYIAGGLLTMVAAALEINANHFQMTYYLLLLLIVIGIYFVIQIVKHKDFKHLGVSVAIFVAAGILSIGANAANLMATAEYTDFSIRGKNELGFNPDGSANTTSSAMEYDYITEYSYGIAESLNLIAPRLFGGGGREDVGNESVMYDFILSQGASATDAENFVKNVPTYWGDQPIVEAPAYIGAVVFFLAVLALFQDRRKIKYAFLAGAILSLMLSWGKNFPALTTFFIDYVPLYDKFRAVSSIQVILELCMPVLALMGLQTFFTHKEKQWENLRNAAAVTLGIFIGLLLIKSSFSFSGLNDGRFKQMYGDIGPAFVDALKEQRESMYTSDVLRSGILVFMVAGIMWVYTKEKLSQSVAVILVGIFLVTDLFFIDKSYVNSDDFVSAREVNNPFQPSEADKYILEDTSEYRVYEPYGRLQGRTSYFHKSVGGYSAVRPRRVDQLFTYNIDNKLPEIVQSVDMETMALGREFPILNMLNVKYLLVQANDGSNVPLENPFANGSAWFTQKITIAESPDEVMKNLNSFNPKQEALIIKGKDTALPESKNFNADSTAVITLDTHKPNYIKYASQNSNDGFAVFSEIYYPYGWNAYIDGKLTPHYEVNYVLRGMNIPAGKHTIEFKFEPQVVQTGGTISLISCILMVLLIGGGVYAERKKAGQQNN